MCMHAGQVPAPEYQGPTSKMPLGKVLRHAGAPEQVGQAQNDALISDGMRRMILNQFQDYLWIDRGGRAVCSACGAESISHAGHKDYLRCPNCGKYVQARHKRYGHKRLKETFYATQWQKSAVEKDALVMIGIYCEMDSSGVDPAHAKKLMVPVLVDLFRYGKGCARWQRSVWSYVSAEGMCEWYRIRDVRSLGCTYFGRKVDVVVSNSNFEDALKDTPFESALRTIRCTLEEQMIFYNGDRSEIIDVIARKPWIEYMIKAGFKSIAISTVGRTPSRILRPRRRHIREILHLSRDRYAEIKGKGLDINLQTLEIIQDADAAGVRIRPEEAMEIDRKLRYHGWKEGILKPYGALDRELIRYLLKNNIDLLMDYWREAGYAQMDMTSRDARLPPNLQEAHDRALELHRALLQAEREKWETEHAKRFESDAKKLEKRLPELERRYGFAFSGLVLRPARSRLEMVNEGNALSHCVGGYFAAYADGRTDICFLRHADEPDKPWRTIEFDVKTGKVIQDRGYKNDRAAGPGKPAQMSDELRAELDAFWAAFYAAHSELKAG